MICKICSSKNLVSISQEVRWELFRCLNCDFFFKISDNFNYNELPLEYFMVYNFDRSKEVKELVNIINSYFNNLSMVNLIEIGCGTGILLQYLLHYGFNVFGYEPSPSAARYANNILKLPNIKNEYFISNNFDISPDIYLLYDVIEHLDDAKELLLNIKHAMNDNTILIIKSGNPLSINARLFLPKWRYFLFKEHIAFYSKKSLELLCKQTGLFLSEYIVFKHAYGGFKPLYLFKNIIKACFLRVIRPDSFMYKKYTINLANDHFIAIIKRR